MNNSIFKTRTLPVAVIALLVLIGLVAVATTNGCGQQSDPMLARYSQLSYNWRPGNRVLVTPSVAKNRDGEVPGIAPIYVQFAAEDVVYLPDLTVDRAREISVKLGWEEYTSTIVDKGVRFADHSSSLKFVGGSLAYARLGSGSNYQSPIIRISLSKDGPFVDLPETKEELVALFGEPLGWERYQPARGP